MFFIYLCHIYILASYLPIIAITSLIIFSLCAGLLSATRIVSVVKASGEIRPKSKHFCFSKNHINEKAPVLLLPSTNGWFLILNPVRMKITGITVEKLVKLCEIVGMKILKTKDNFTKVVIVPNHKEVREGTMRSIRKQAGEVIDINELDKFFKN